MGRLLKTAATLTASAVSRHNRKKSLRRIKKINDANRNIIYIGKGASDQIIPCFSQIGNICITGGEQEQRNKLLIQSALQAASLGIHGKETTPFLLDKIQKLTGGDSLKANIQLVYNNARLAAKTAGELCKLANA